MRILEILVGFGIVTAALASVARVLEGLVPLPALGPGTAGVVVTLGSALMLDGVLGRMRMGASDARTRKLRATGRAAWTVFATIAIVLAAPAFTRPMSVVSIAGFPLGYWFVAQGAAILLVILAFRHTARSEELDDSSGPGPSG